MTHLSLNTDALADAFRDYERAKQVWDVLSKKQRENDNQTTFPLDKKLLNDLGFTKEDFHDNMEDLQCVLSTLHEFTWHWDRRGPLLPEPGEPAPIAYIVDGSLVIGPLFSNARTAFAAYSKTQERDNSE
jgi:hypothetical protein